MTAAALLEADRVYDAVAEQLAIDPAVVLATLADEINRPLVVEES